MKSINSTGRRGLLVWLALSAAILATTTWGATAASSTSYQLSWEAKGDTFFDKFQFMREDDPTNGFVNYIDQQTAQDRGIISVEGNGQVRLGTDTQNVVAAEARGRDSVRLESSQLFTGGLFLADLAHMPTGCGTWPAWWLYGQDWPNSGEIDIIEGVNVDTMDATTLHTGANCSMSGIDGSQFMTGSYTQDDCQVHPDDEAGCGVYGPEGSYGAPFNNASGGVYAVEWTTEHISAWFFARSAGLPADITSGSPDPSTWGKPYAYFALGTNCPANNFRNHTITINLTFCGDYVNSVWSGSSCEAQANNSTCADYVRNNPQQFKEAYWLFNHVRVYQLAPTPSGDHSAANSLAPSFWQ